MISIDTVYQRVLAILNKEQRGYLSPQEFNLFANQAQLEIFEQYFFDLNQYMRLKDNNTEYAQLYNLVDEKISKFKTYGNLTYSSGAFAFPADLHKLGTVIYNSNEVEKVDMKQLLDYQASKLTQPSATNPLYIQDSTSSGSNWSITLYPSTVTSGVSCTYVKKPAKAEWAYVNVNNVALYNANDSVDFEIHESDETNLVFKILLYAGLNIKASEVAQVADAKETKQITQEKS
jgi:hypothetical protein